MNQICETCGQIIRNEKYGKECKEVFDVWRVLMNHPRARLDLTRKAKIVAALKVGYSVSDLKDAVEGCKLTSFNMGDNDRGQVYDDLELILRDAKHIDMFISNKTNPPERPELRWEE